MRKTSLLALLLLFISCAPTSSSTDAGTSATTQKSSKPAHRDPSGRLVYLFPKRLPDGIEMDKLQDYQLPREREAPGGYGAVVGIEKSNTEFTEVIGAVVHEAKSDRDVGPDRRKEYEIVDINGVPARFIDQELIGANVDWFQNGLAVGMVGPPGTREVVIAIARALSLPQSGDATAVRLGRLPKGQKLVAEHSFSSYTGSSYSFHATSTRDKDPRSLIVNVSTVPDSFGPTAAGGGSDRLRYRTIRGTAAAVGSSSREMSSSRGSIPIRQTSVGWLEYPDVLVFIVGGGIGEKEIVAFAEGLEEVSEQEWRSRFES